MEGVIILVVDDDDMLRLMVKEMLEVAGYKPIFCAASGEEGLKILSEHPAINLVISDYHMIGMNGLEFLEKARLINPGLKRIIISGNHEMEKMRGDICFLGKPFNGQLLKIVEQLLVV